MKALVLLLSLAAAASALGYEQSMPSLAVPYTMDAGEMELAIQHRFTGEAFDDPFGDFLGADLGANMFFGTRFFAAAGLEIDLSHTRTMGEYSLGAGWNGALDGAPLGFHADVSLLSLEQPVAEDPENRESSFYGQAGVAAGPFADRLTVVANAGYDSNAGRTCLGFGVEGAVSERVSLVGEFVPAMDGDEDHPAADASCWTASMRIDTWGHQFGMIFTNSTGIGLRALAGGVYEVDDLVRLGFFVKRQLSIPWL
jgi:hypothetical protein